MILGIGGYAESGKDAFADYMVEIDEVWFKTYMSYSLEMALLALDPFVPLDLGRMGQEWVRYSEFHGVIGYTQSKKNAEVRRLLQKLGTEVGRDMFGSEVWVDKMLEIAAEHEHTIVTGIRYHNELRAIKTHGGVSVWVDRPGVEAVNAHTSDNTLTRTDFDWVINNSGSLEDLRTIAGDTSRVLLAD